MDSVIEHVVVVTLKMYLMILLRVMTIRMLLNAHQENVEMSNAIVKGLVSPQVNHLVGKMAFVQVSSLCNNPRFNLL